VKRLLIILAFLPISGTAQDSLWNLWNSASSHDTVKAQVLHDITWTTVFQRPDSAYKLAEKLIAFSNETNQTLFKAKALKIQGISLYFRGDYGGAVAHYNKSLVVFNEINDQKGVAAIHINMGAMFMGINQPDTAILEFESAIKIYKEIGAENEMISPLNNLGLVHCNYGRYQKGIEYYNQAIALSEKLGDKKGIAHNLIALGIASTALGHSNVSIGYHEKALKLFTEINDYRGVISANNSLGAAYGDLGNYPKSIEHLEMSIKMAKEMGDKSSLATAYVNISVAVWENLDTTKSLFYLDAALAIREEFGDEDGIASVCNNLGKIHRLLKHKEEALKYTMRAYDIGQKLGDIHTIQHATDILNHVYKDRGDWENAYFMLELHVAARDSLASDELQKTIIRQQTTYQYEKDKLALQKEQEKKDAIAAKDSERQQVIITAISMGLGILILFALYFLNRYRASQRQKQLIEQQKIEVENQRDLVAEKNKEIMDSINYARNIQAAILPPTKLVKEYLQNSFLLYKPKDVVAGDFYWMEPTNKGVIFAAADCTGHGVPGAMMSVMCSNALTKCVKELKITDPGKILDQTTEIIEGHFKRSEANLMDGMDLALCNLDLSTNELKYAGANNPLWLLKAEGADITEIKADKQPIGHYENRIPYTTHIIQLQTSDTIYIFSDGYQDQFGGQRGKKFKSRPMREMILNMRNESMDRQREIFDDTFEDWRGGLEQVDDVCLIGVRI